MNEAHLAREARPAGMAARFLVYPAAAKIPASGFSVGQDGSAARRLSCLISMQLDRLSDAVEQDRADERLLQHRMRPDVGGALA